MGRLPKTQSKVLLTHQARPPMVRAKWLIRRESGLVVCSESTSQHCASPLSRPNIFDSLSVMRQIQLC